jgi:hypothetical protein
MYVSALQMLYALHGAWLIKMWNKPVYKNTNKS